MAQSPTFTKRKKASTTKQGGMKMAAAQADSTATDVATLKTDFNALLAKLRAAGHLAP